VVFGVRGAPEVPGDRRMEKWYAEEHTLVNGVAAQKKQQRRGLSLKKGRTAEPFGRRSILPGARAIEADEVVVDAAEDVPQRGVRKAPEHLRGGVTEDRPVGPPAAR